MSDEAPDARAMGQCVWVSLLVVAVLGLGVAFSFEGEMGETLDLCALLFGPVFFLSWLAWFVWTRKKPGDE